MANSPILTPARGASIGHLKLCNCAFKKPRLHRSCFSIGTRANLPARTISVQHNRKTSVRKTAEHSLRAVRSSMATACLPSDEDVAVVLVDHGSKRSEANDMLEEFAALYRSFPSPYVVAF